MKKILSFSLIAMMATNAFSQTLLTDNFESYTVGNLGTKGGWAADGGSASMAKIANIDAAHGKSFQFASTATNVDGMFVYKEFNWDGRTEDNDILVADFDIYTGSNYAEVQFYDVNANYYAVADLYLSPTYGAYLATQDDFDNEESGELLTSNISANTWYKAQITYNSTNGEITVTLNGTKYGPFVRLDGLSPNEIDFAASGVNNGGFDNIVVQAVDKLLAVDNVKSKAKLSIYPNPTTDVVNVVASKKIDSVSFFDAAGKVVKESKESTINVQDLTKGLYILKINYADSSSETSKIIKK